MAGGVVAGVAGDTGLSEPSYNGGGAGDTGLSEPGYNGGGLVEYGLVGEAARGWATAVAA